MKIKKITFSTARKATKYHISTWRHQPFKPTRRKLAKLQRRQSPRSTHALAPHRHHPSVLRYRHRPDCFLGWEYFVSPIHWFVQVVKLDKSRENVNVREREKRKKKPKVLVAISTSVWWKCIQYTEQYACTLHMHNIYCRVFLNIKWEWKSKLSLHRICKSQNTKVDDN